MTDTDLPEIAASRTVKGIMLGEIRVLKNKANTFWERQKGRWRSTWAALTLLRNLRQKLRGKWLCNGRAYSCGDLTGSFIMYHVKHESYGWYYVASMNYLVLGNFSCVKHSQMSTWLDCGRYESIWKMDAKMQRNFIEKMLLSMFSQKLFRSDLLSCSTHIALYGTIH